LDKTNEFYSVFSMGLNVSRLYHTIEYTLHEASACM
jgi:hypothetical protein